MSTIENKEMNVSFWANDPNVLFRPQYLTEIFPSSDMPIEQQLNAVTRLIIYFTIIMFAFTGYARTLVISSITIGSIFLVYKHKYNKNQSAEGFNTVSNVVMDTLHDQNINIKDDLFQAPSVDNPFSNVLMSDYDYNVDKKPAPPGYNEAVSTDILTQAKQLIRETHPDQPEIAEKLFTDLGEQYVFERSLQPFYSTANTTIPNDQKAFAEFCYGSMISCKEGNQFACARNLARHTN